MNTTINSALQTSLSVLSSVKDLSSLIHSWADNRGILGSFQRYLQEIQTKIPDFPQETLETITRSYALLRVMQDPRLSHRCIADEKELPRSFSGPELQLLNNVQFHKPWKFDFFRLLDQIQPGVLRIQSLMDQEIAVLFLHQAGDDQDQSSKTHQSENPAFFEPGVIWGSILIPLGEVEITPGDSGSKLSAVVGWGSALTIPRFSEPDLLYWLEASAAKKGIPADPSMRIGLQHLWTMVEAMIVPGCLLLSHYPQLVHQLEQDEEPSLVACHSIWLGNMKDQQPFLDSSTIEGLGAFFEEEEFHLEERSNWVMMESLKKRDGIVQPRQLFYCKTTGQLMVRVMGSSPEVDFQRLAQGINTFLQALPGNTADSSTTGTTFDEPPYFPPKPDLLVGLTALVLGQDLYGLEIPGPPQDLIHGLLVGY